MIEVGAGAGTSVDAKGPSGFEMLLRVGFKVSEATGDTDRVLGPEQLVLARIVGDFSFSAQEGSQAVRYVDIRLIPISSSVLLGSDDAAAMLATLELLPIDISRNISIDSKLSLDVRVIGARLGNRLTVHENVSFFTELAGKLLGYKMRLHLDTALDHFHGASLGEVAGAAGAAFNLGDVVLRIYVGGDADLALGESAERFAVQSDLNVLAGMVLDISESVRRAIPKVSGMTFFLTGGYSHFFNTGNESSGGAGRLLGGFSLIF